jgi:hypothetical protein
MADLELLSVVALMRDLPEAGLARADRWAPLWRSLVLKFSRWSSAMTVAGPTPPLPSGPMTFCVCITNHSTRRLNGPGIIDSW